MRSTVSRWGNSLAVRLPRALTADAHLQEGTPVNLRVQDGSLVITPARPKYKLADLLAQLEQGGERGEVDWGQPEGKEVW